MAATAAGDSCRNRVSELSEMASIVRQTERDPMNAMELLRKSEEMGPNAGDRVVRVTALTVRGHLDQGLPSGLRQWLAETGQLEAKYQSESITKSGN